MRTLHIVSHTHWDREWYRTFQQFRLRLVQLIDNLLDLLERDKNFKFFMLDGQTIVLDDYLAIRSENEKILRDHIRKGRILTGPWHILPDMFLVGPEAHIRNLLEGDRTARKFGSKMMIGYMPDSFGHFAQMPQLIRGFGMDVISVWRGLDDQPAEFWWEAPDGSRVLMAYLRDSYSNGASLQPSIPSEFAAQLERAADSLAAHSEVSHYLIMFGNDHMEPPRDTSKAIAYANAALRGTKVIHSTLPNYIKAIEKQITREEIHLPIYKGELRSSKNSHLLPGVLSTRMWIKQRNHACETLLEKWAEPFSTLAGLQGKKLEGLQVKKLEGSQVKKLEGLQAKKLEGSQVGTFKPANIQTFQLIKDPAQILHNAWRLLMECHPHDSICGCSIDQVHEEMKSRFDQVEQIGEEITRQSLETLAGMINTSHWGSVSGDQSAIVVFNPSSAPRTDLVSMELSLPDGVQNFDLLDENGTIVLHQSASGNSSEWINVNIQREELGGILAMVHEGRAGNLVIQDINFKRANNIVHVEAIMSENGSPNLKAWEEGTKALQGYIEDSSVELFHIRAHSRQSTHILFAASDVPAFGWKTFRVRGKESAPESVHITPLMRALAPLAASPFAQKILARFTQSKSRPPYRIENEFFMVEAASDATLIITDKRDGQIYRGLNRFVDGGDCGDEYNFCPPLSDLQAGARLKSVRTAKGAVLQTLELDLDLRVPSELAPDRKSRSLDFISVPITTHITLAAGIARVDVQTKVDNRAKDHRLRVHFPAPFKVDAADYDSHFEIINRKIGLPPFDETWIEQPRPEVPQRAFADVSDGQHGLMIANRGLPEVEVLKNKDGNSEIALTLLRCVGWLSRDDFPARKGHAGPFLATPAAQMQGAWTFDYSIIPHSGNWKEAFQLAYAFETPLRGVSAALHDGALPASGSFVEITPSTFVVSAIKESEDRSGWIVRGINLTDEKINASIRPWRQFKKVERVNLAEQKIESLKPAPEGTVTVEARGKEIVTVMFSD
jgi:mannosylglycerate hydrolase